MADTATLVESSETIQFDDLVTNTIYQLADSDRFFYVKKYEKPVEKHAKKPVEEYIEKHVFNFFSIEEIDGTVRIAPASQSPVSIIKNKESDGIAKLFKKMGDKSIHLVSNQEKYVQIVNTKSAYNRHGVTKIIPDGDEAQKGIVAEKHQEKLDDYVKQYIKYRDSELAQTVEVGTQEEVPTTSQDSGKNSLNNLASDAANTTKPIIFPVKMSKKPLAFPELRTATLYPLNIQNFLFIEKTPMGVDFHIYGKNSAKPLHAITINTDFPPEEQESQNKELALFLRKTEIFAPNTIVSVEGKNAEWGKLPDCFEEARNKGEKAISKDMVAAAAEKALQSPLGPVQKIEMPTWGGVSELILATDTKDGVDKLLAGIKPSQNSKKKDIQWYEFKDIKWQPFNDAIEKHRIGEDKISAYITAFRSQSRVVLENYTSIYDAMFAKKFVSDEARSAFKNREVYLRDSFNTQFPKFKRNPENRTSRGEF